MNEVKLYGGLLIALMVGAYVSWTREEGKSTEAKVTIVDAQPEQVDRIALYTKTQTVAVGSREIAGEKYAWFEVTSRGKTRQFVGNDKAVDLTKSFAPFEALRSLGKDLSEKELATTKLDKPERSLELTVSGKMRSFDLGGRTSGARDHYLRAKGGSGDVYLVASKILGDLEFPEGKFMQRKLRNAESKEVEKVLLAAGDKTLTGIQKNRLSPKDSFWTKEGSEEKDEALKNFVEKLDKLTAIEYPTDAQKSMDAGVTVLEATWHDEAGKELGRMKLTRTGEGKKADYFAMSTATKTPVKVSRFTAEQLESSLKGILH